MKPVLKALFILVGLGALGGLVMFFVITSRGISARAEPGAFETVVARTMRRFAVPRAERNRQNPVPYSDEVFAAGKEHWADHCAACHGNDGSGETAIGLGLYPKPPDMRLALTQSLSDGEIFYLIENGIRLTGMPAWGNGTPVPKSPRSKFFDGTLASAPCDQKNQCVLDASVPVLFTVLSSKPGCSQYF